MQRVILVVGEWTAAICVDRGARELATDGMDPALVHLDGMTVLREYAQVSYFSVRLRWTSRLWVIT
jgi:hypothetical protein